MGEVVIVPVREASALRLDRNLDRVIGDMGEATYNSLSRDEDAMEADEINAIDNTLADIAQRAAELRRYL